MESSNLKLHETRSEGEGVASPIENPGKGVAKECQAIRQCGMCGSESFTEIEEFPGTSRLYRSEKFLYARCSQCCSIGRLADTAPNYHDYFTRDAIPLLECRRLEKFLASFGIGKNATILDYGCGQGALISRLKRRGFKKILGYEPFQDGHRASLHKKKFEIVCLIHVFEHLLDFNTLFSHLENLLNPGGQVLVISPCSNRIPKLDNHCAFQKYTIHAPFHTVIPSEKSVIRLFEDHGFHLKALLPYDIQKSGFLRNNLVYALFMEALGETKDGALSASFFQKIISLAKDPLAFLDRIFLKTRDNYVGTFVFTYSTAAKSFGANCNRVHG